MRRFERAAEEKKRREATQKLEIFACEPEKILLNAEAENRKRPPKHAASA
jgi:hypothetical protein